MKILLTGASGFVGNHLIEQLRESGHELLVISRNVRPSSQGVSWIKGDLSAPLQLVGQIAQFEPEAVFHLAWEGIPDFSEQLCTENVVMSLSFLSMIGGISSVKKIIITGSCWEYGAQIGSCSENDRTQPSNWFTWAKDAVYQYAKRSSEARGTNWYWARIFFVYGPNQRSNSLIPTVIRALRAGGIPDIRSPYARNDFVHVQDVVEGLECFLRENIPSGIYNFGSGSETTVLEIVAELVGLLSSGENVVGLLESSAASAAGASPSFHADTGKSLSTLGWKSKISISQGLQRMLDGT